MSDKQLQLQRGPASRDDGADVVMVRLWAPVSKPCSLQRPCVRTCHCDTAVCTRTVCSIAAAQRWLVLSGMLMFRAAACDKQLAEAFPEASLGLGGRGPTQCKCLGVHQPGRRDGVRQQAARSRVLCCVAE
jgi:hypothetical protein